MKPLLVALSFALALALSACSDKAKELYDTAQFEELQTNHEHARRLYESIVRDYADSELAAKAKERLAVLDAAH